MTHYQKLEYQRKYHEEHKEQEKAYYEKNRAKYNAYCRNYYKQNKWRWEDYKVKAIIKGAKND